MCGFVWLIPMSGKNVMKVVQSEIPILEKMLMLSVLILTAVHSLILGSEMTGK